MKFVLLYLLIILSPLYPQNITNNEYFQKQRRFAYELMQDREYYRAITEFYRINSYFPENPEYIQNLNNIALCYGFADHYVESIHVCQKILEQDSLNWSAILSIARAYQKIDDFYESNRHIGRYKYQLSEAYRDSLQLLAFINLLNLRQYGLAGEALKEIEQNSILKPIAVSFDSQLESGLPLKTKSKTKTILLASALPGSGYFYANRHQTAFAAFFVNLIFGYATYDSFRSSKTGLGIFTGFFAIGFYSGSIYGAIQAVDSFNKDLSVRFIKNFNFQ